jgi:hypothetical protein
VGPVTVKATTRLIDPQLSFNFGTAQGWSYLSVGLGTARVKTSSTGTDAVDATYETGSLRAINVGGGARWYLASHLGVGFDLRFHKLAAGAAQGSAPGMPATNLLSASVGLAVR